MKIIRRDNEGFNLSFLDIISCAFGAIVILIIISRNGETDAEIKIDTRAALQRTFAVEEQLRLLDELQQKLKLRLAENQGSNQVSRLTVAQLKVKKKTNAEHSASLERENRALSEEQKTIKSISLNADTSTTQDTLEVGGIPVDSDYIVFVIDTSGSMKKIWAQVRKTLLHVLEIHPKVRGFQVLNDNGRHLLPEYTNRWIKDSKSNRDLVKQRLRAPAAASNSSPIEGIQFALRQYVKDGSDNVAIYVFGDDYSSGSYDKAVNLITSINEHKWRKRPKARIHGVGFFYPRQTTRFATVMRAIAESNKGTFLALARE